MLRAFLFPFLYRFLYTLSLSSLVVNSKFLSQLFSDRYVSCLVQGFDALRDTKPNTVIRHIIYNSIQLAGDGFSNI